MPFKRAPSCATGPRSSVLPQLLALQRSDLLVLRLERLLQLTSLREESRHVSRNRQPPVAGEPEELLPEVRQLAVERSSGESGVELPLADLRPDDDPVPERFQPVAQMFRPRRPFLPEGAQSLSRRRGRRQARSRCAGGRPPTAPATARPPCIATPRLRGGGGGQAPALLLLLGRQLLRLQATLPALASLHDHADVLALRPGHLVSWVGAFVA